MKLWKPTLLALTALSLAGLLAVACGDDSGNGAGPDAGGNEAGPGTDGGNDANPGTDSGNDAGDGGCDFNAFVLDLVNNHTTATDLPSTDLGDQCVDNHTLFPQTIF